MKTQDLKSIWQSGIDPKINNYSEEKLNQMIVDSAKKAMKPIRIGWILRAIVVGVSALLIWQIFFWNKGWAYTLFCILILLILIIPVFWAEYSYRLMNKYSCDKPIKEWLELRIKDVKKSIDIITKYGLLMKIGAFISGYSVYLLSQYLLGTFNWWVSILVVFIIGGILMLTPGQKHHFQKTLEELEALYRGLEE